MKHYKIALIVLVVALQACKNEKITLSGETENLKGKVYLAYAEKHNENFWDSAVLLDSTEIQQNTFSFQVPKEKRIYRIFFAERKDFPLWVVAGEKNLSIKKINPEKPTEMLLEGADDKDKELFKTFWGFFTTYKQNLKTDSLYVSLEKLWQAESNEKAKDSLKGLLQQRDWVIYKDLSEKNYPLLNASMPSLTAIAFAEHLDLLKDYVFLKEFADKVAQQMPEDKHGERFIEFIGRLHSPELDKLRPAKIGLNVGDIAPDFTLPTPEGKPISLASFRGKVLLIDFWAAWCRPCRMENPNVVAAYKKFKHKGFDILGVSLDDDKEKWLKAIEKDELTWTHVSDLKMWDSAILPIYQINAIPMNFLLDKDGRILAKNLRGPALEQALNEVFASK